jgi:hypothetical protein
MPSNLDAAEIYRREADRLRTMAGSTTYGEVRNGLLAMAAQYDHLAEQASSITSHRFGQPFGRRTTREPTPRA